jgi:V8-like Glu-specific endopeptidase
VVPAATETEQDSAEESLLVEPRSVGTEGAHFTSSRLVPLKADQVYPYRTVGKLFFRQRQGGSDKVCSASVIKARLILTAGHCVHPGSGVNSPFFTDFLFIPAFRDGMDPYGSWHWAFVWTTRTWMTGGGEFPNAADYALIELQDNPRGQRIADVVGFLGFETHNLIPNHAHLLGYPNNLDGGMKMHQVTAGSFREAFPNAAEYGSDMSDGSSGGPWVQNFGQVADGQAGKMKANRVIGVTSYGRIDPKRKVQGSSILDERFIELLDLACARRQGNC